MKPTVIRKLCQRVRRDCVSHDAALMVNGAIKSIGEGTEGSVYLQKHMLEGVEVADVAIGPWHMAVLTTDGIFMGWGWYQGPSWGGDPRWGAAPPEFSNVVAIAAGTDFTVALKSDGTVIEWDTEGKQRPTRSLGLTDVIAIAAGKYHALALKRDGTVIAWGIDSHGRSQRVPDRMQHDVVDIAACGSVSMVRKADGYVGIWE